MRPRNPTLGLAMIVREEEENLPRLLASIEDAFDQVAVLDTGSTDRTVEVFKAWAARQRLPRGHRFGRFEWRDDFAAARNAADELLDTDWLSYADADNLIQGARILRARVAEAAARDCLAMMAAHVEFVAPECPEIGYRPFCRDRRAGGRWEGGFTSTWSSLLGLPPRRRPA